MQAGRERSAASIGWLLWLCLVFAALQSPAEVAHAAAREETRLAPRAAPDSPLWRCAAAPAGMQATADRSRAARPLASLLPEARAGRAIHCAASQSATSLQRSNAEIAPHQAGLVVDFGNGQVVTYCIELGAGGQISGMELLRASQLPIVVEVSGGVGGAVCKIGDVGSNFPSEPCFAQCTLQPGTACIYWSYSRLEGDHWRYAQLGPSSTTVQAGEVDGWAWGSGTVAQGAQPPPVTFASVCAPDVATATATAAPSPTQTATPIPATATATPSPTQQVIAIPAATPTATATPPPTAAATLGAQPTPAATSTPAPTLLPTAEGAVPTTIASATATGAPTAPVPQPTPPMLAPATPAAAEPAAGPPSTAAAPTPAPAAERLVDVVERIWLPLQARAPLVEVTTSVPAPPPQRAAVTPSAVVRPTVTSTTTPSGGTRTPERAAQADDPRQTYPAFAGLAMLLIAVWAFVRQRSQ